MFKKKKQDEVCGNCRLYNADKKTCRIAVLHAGEQIHIPVSPEDLCFFEENYFDPGEKISDHVKQIRWWVENPDTGEQDNEGIVKIELPEDFNSPS